MIAALRRTLTEMLDSKQAMALLSGVFLYVLIRLANKLGVPLEPDTAKEIADRMGAGVLLYMAGQIAIHITNGPASPGSPGVSPASSPGAGDASAAPPAPADDAVTLTTGRAGGVALKALLLVLALALALGAGCATVSSAALGEAHRNLAAAENVLDHWSSLTDLQKQEAVWKLARGQASVLESADGSAIPVRFTTGPWATSVAPVKS